MLLRYLDSGARQESELRSPEPSDVARLRQVSGGPAVSLIVATTPGEGIDADDLFRVAAMLAEVERRLRAELGAIDAVSLSDRCRAMVIDLVDERMGRGLALFVSAAGSEAFRLDHTPTERVVIDPNFATRELEFAARHQPRCRVLAVGGDGVRYFHVVGDVVAERSTARFPVLADSLDGVAASVSRVVDGLLGDRELADLPLVVVGPRELTEWICRRADVAPIGSVDADAASLDDVALGVLARSVHWSQRAREREIAFTLLDDAMIGGKAAVGLDDVWRAVCGGSVDVVLVDPTAARGGEIDPVTHHVRWVDDPTSPGVTDDLVDEMIELTSLSGGAVVFVEPGSLGDDGVAAIIGEHRQAVSLDRLVVA